MRNIDIRLVELIIDQRQSPSGYIRVKCPYCPSVYGKPDRRSSLRYEPQTGWYYCYRCKTHGKLDIENQVDVGSPEKIDDSPYLGPPEGFEDIDSPVEMMDQARAYLAARNVSPSMCKTLGIGACLFGRYFGRIIIPVKDEAGDWLGWVGRSWIKKSDVPYLYPYGMDRGRILFNQVALNTNLLKPLMVVEGVFDAIHLWPHAVAVLGKPTGKQLDLLANSVRPVVFVLDGDATTEAWALAAQFRMSEKNAGYVALPAGKDPDDFPAEKVMEWARESLNNPL